MDRNSACNDENKPPPAPIWIDLGGRGCVGRTLGIAACTVAGAIGGALGSILPYLAILHTIAGWLLQPEPGIAGPILQVGWVMGLYGVLPGAVVGFVTALTRGPSARIALCIGALVMSCGCLWFPGYPASIPAFCFYAFEPFFVTLASMFLSTAIKIRLGLMPPGEAAEAEQTLDSLLPAEDT